MLLSKLWRNTTLREGVYGTYVQNIHYNLKMRVITVRETIIDLFPYCSTDWKEDNDIVNQLLPCPLSFQARCHSFETNIAFICHITARGRSQIRWGDLSCKPATYNLVKLKIQKTNCILRTATSETELLSQTGRLMGCFHN